MNKKILVVLLTISVILLVSGTSMFYNGIAKAEGDGDNTFVVWVMSDNHVGGQLAAGCSLDTLSDVINDSNIYFDWDICLVVGDQVQIPNDSNYTLWQDTILSYSNHPREDFYVIAGNHEGQCIDYPDNSPSTGYFYLWQKYADPKGTNTSTSYVNSTNRTYPICNDSVSGGAGSPDDGQFRYTFEAHNIEFIMMSIDIWLGGGSPDGHPYNSWYNTIVDDTSDKIKIVCTHLPISDCGLALRGGTAAIDSAHGASFKSKLQSNPKATDIWLTGHNHYLEGTGETRFINTWNTTFINIADTFGNLNNCRGRSFIFTFTNNSNQVTMGEFHHYYNDWEHTGQTNPGNHTITLHHDFIYQSTSEEETLQFISIDGGGNGTIITSNIPVINWTVTSNAIKYSLQIATDSSFTNIVTDLADINIYNYPTEYNEVGSTVSFTLPSANALSVFQTYYFRVRAYR